MMVCSNACRGSDNRCGWATLMSFPGNTSRYLPNNLHRLNSTIITTNMPQEPSVIAQTHVVLGIGFYGPLVHHLRPIIITTDLLEEADVVDEAEGLDRIDEH